MPPRRQVVTLEEKKARILSFFQDEYSFYTLKELEKLVPKRCAGVSSMLVKDLIQQMIDEDGIVSVEKCGNINVYWSFKNQAQQKLYDSCQSMELKIKTRQEEIEQLQKKQELALKNGRSDTFLLDGVKYDRNEQIALNKSLEDDYRKLQAEYDQLTKTRWDDAKITAKELELQTRTTKLNTITDNIELIIDFLSKKFMVNSKDICRELEIPEEFTEIA